MTMFEDKDNVFDGSVTGGSTFEPEKTRNEGTSTGTEEGQESSPESAEEGTGEDTAAKDGAEPQDGDKTEETGEIEESNVEGEDGDTGDGDEGESSDDVNDKVLEKLLAARKKRGKSGTDNQQTGQQAQQQEQVQQIQQSGPGQQYTEEQLNEMARSNPARFMAFLAQAQARQMIEPYEEQVKDLQMQSEVSKVAAKYPDFKDISNDVVEFLESTPSMWSMSGEGVSPLEAAYHIVKGQKTEELTKQARENGKKEAAANREAKKQAHVEGQKSSNKLDNTSKKTPEEEVKETILGGVKNDFDV